MAASLAMIATLLNTPGEVCDSMGDTMRSQQLLDLSSFRFAF